LTLMTDATVADSLVGTLVDGRYRVRDRIARGGMATVYEATDERLDRPVALKMVHTVQPDERVVSRFVDEAKAIARLTHPNVVAAYDQGSHDGAPFLVMEYVQGRTLREILNARRRLTPVEALAITEQMLSAIAAAHRAGLVHRDVKPENVLVAESPSGGSTNLVDCVVKVTDFGLAQAVQTAAATDGGLLATAAYVAPELVTEGRADPRSDVYSTGIVLFEMLTGRVPFDGADPAEVAWRHVEEEVPAPSRYVAGLPYAVDNLAVWATRRDQALRPSDAGVLLNDVQAVREKVTTSATRRSPGGSSDATVQMPAVRGEPERPAWSRLPEPRTRTLTRPLGPPRAGRRHAAGDAIRRRRAVLAAFGAVLLLLLALGGWWFGIGRWMPAPDLVGLPEAEAVAEAQDRGLTVRFADPAYDEQVPAGHVLEQDPETRVIRGGTITLTLSRGPEVHPVPDVVGASLEVATRRLQELGLVVVEGEPEYSNTVPEGRVLSVEPAVGTEVRPGTEVTVVVSQGQAPITVPTVTDKNVDQATAELQALGLQVAVTESEERDRPQGTVVDQDPPAGSGAEPGDTVTLEVSPGPPVSTVPNVTGQECGEAERILTEGGFRVARIGNQRLVGFQNPSAGTGLPPNSQVTIVCNLP
jgi:beta-lactam-binding protein with PASTA domain/tRNA A-37 threonylcarbamoyl transferase component Bud32